MAVFTNNQVRQFYVVNTVNSYDNITKEDSAGTIYFQGTDVTPIESAGKKYFQYKDATGKIVRTDVITNVESVKITRGTDVEHKAKIATIIMKDAPVVGQDYVVKILIKNYVGMSDIYQIIKDGAARAFSTEKGDLLEDLAVSLFRNLSREVSPFVVIGNGTDTIAKVKEGKAYNEAGDEIDFDKITITEVEQPQVIGKFTKEPVNFEVFFGTIKSNGVETNEWAKVEYSKGGVIISSVDKAAEMEHFYMGNRGDIYRGMAFPNNIDTQYLVDKTATGYNFIDIHYSYVGANESVQKSEKDLTLAIKEGILNEYLGGTATEEEIKQAEETILLKFKK